MCSLSKQFLISKFLLYFSVFIIVLVFQHCISVFSIQQFILFSFLFSILYFRFYLVFYIIFVLTI